MTSWAEYTPTGSWTTNATYVGYWRQVGDSMECRVEVFLAGAPADVTLYVSIPAGYTIDFAKFPGGSGAPIGHAEILDEGLTRFAGQVLTAGDDAAANGYDLTGYVQPIVFKTATWTLVDGISADVPFFFGAGDQVFLVFAVPIVEFDG